MNEAERNVVYVSEVWENKKAHQESLILVAVRHLIEQTMPILDLSKGSDYPEVTIYGGKAEL